MNDDIPIDNAFMSKDKWIENIFKNNSVFAFVFLFILYIIGYTYINDDESKYVSTIFLLFINCTFPFVWLKEFVTIIPTLQSYSPYMLYTTFYKVITALVIIALQIYTNILQIAFNEKERYDKEKKGIAETAKDNKNNENISWFSSFNNKLFTLFLFFIIGDLAGDLYPIVKSNQNIPFINGIGWLLQQPFHIVSYLQSKWHNTFNSGIFSPLINYFFIYSISFLVLFFGFFIKLDLSKSGIDVIRFYQTNGITHAPNTFGTFFYDNKHLIDKIMSVVLPLTIFIVFFAILNVFGVGMYTQLGAGLGLTWFIKSFVIDTLFSYINTSNHKGSYTKNPEEDCINDSDCINAKCRSYDTTKSKQCLFENHCFLKRTKSKESPGSCEETPLNTSTYVKTKVYIFYSALFSSLFIPLILSALQLFAELGLFTPISLLLGKEPVNSINQGNSLSIIGIVSFLLIYAYTFISGIINNWFEEDKIMKFMNVFIICNIVGIIMGLSTNYKIFTGLYNVLSSIKYASFLLLPIIILMFSLINFISSFLKNMK